MGGKQRLPSGEKCVFIMPALSKNHQKLTPVPHLAFLFSLKLLPGDTRFLAKEGTATQVKFWLVNYLNSGVFEEMSGWADITDQIEKANRKGKKKHG